MKMFILQTEHGDSILITNDEKVLRKSLMRDVELVDVKKLVPGVYDLGDIFAILRGN
jgi:hypothetical protein